MAASSSGEGFWFSDPHHRSCDYQLPHDDEELDPYGGGDESCYYPYAYGDPNGGTNWEERCLELEMSLQRFRDQAGKIRGLLREKVQFTTPPSVKILYHLLATIC